MKLRAFVLSRDQHLCQTCKRQAKVTPATEVDHVTPKARGGTDDRDNLEAICSPCHQRKTRREVGDANRKTPALEFDERGFPVWPEGR